MISAKVPSSPSELHCVDLEELMQGCKKIILRHGQRPYFLTITRKGNLILTSATEAQIGLARKPDID